MRNIFLSVRNSRPFTSIVFFTAAVAVTISTLHADEKRTDGKPGSEYSDFSSWDGEFRVGAQFGAVLPTAGSQESSFALGLDADYRPFELFGFRGTYLQGLKSPRTSLISLTPYAHTTYSNITPYFMAGPGIAFTNAHGTETKFAIAFGVGADINIVERLSIGMLWTYHALIDSFDVHSLTARFAFRF